MSIPGSQAQAAKHQQRPPAIVLCTALTGLATVRALASQGVQVHALVFDKKDPLRLSRHPHATHLLPEGLSDTDLVQFILDYAKRLGQRPVLMATSDRHVMALTRHAHALREAVHWWQTDLPTLATILEKDRLYLHADELGLPTIPSTPCADLPAVSAWCRRFPGPYLLKPSYVGCADAKLAEKNKVFVNSTSLLAFLPSTGSRALLVQQLMAGGDGEIFDTYGFCDAKGQIVCLSTHRRLRQFPPDLGSTSYGEIPARLGQEEAILLSQTRVLLQSLRYHGIFGIEWLRDRTTNRFHLIDFNARPFSSIGHLRDCGVNLPWLAYQELTGQTTSPLPLVPTLQHRYWVDLFRDSQAREHPRTIKGSASPSRWQTLRQASSFAYWEWLDPGPALLKTAALLWSKALRSKTRLQRLV